MKKFFISLLANIIFCALVFSESPPEIERPNQKPFPSHWGEPPAAQTKDLRPLPGGFGMGSSTLARWVGENLKKDQADGKRPEKPGVERPKPRPHFPEHWGNPPEIQLTDHVQLPGGFGMGSSTLANWIKENIAEDKKNEKPDHIGEFRRLEKLIAEKKNWIENNRTPNSPFNEDFLIKEKELKELQSRFGELKKMPEVETWGKPEVLTDMEKLEPRKFEGDVLKKVKEGKLSQEDARKKLSSLRDEMEKKGLLKRPKRLAKPKLDDSVKESLENIKAQQKKLHESMKAKLAELGEGATKEQMRAEIEKFKEDNKADFDKIKADHESIRESMKAARPEKPERPELTEELKDKVDALKEKHKELHTARKELSEQLKEASKEEKQELIAEFKENNKAKHQEIKNQSKEIIEDIRELVETEATRTSDR